MVTVNTPTDSALYELFDSKQPSAKMVPLNNTFIPEIQSLCGNTYSRIGLMVKSNAASVGPRVRFLADKRYISTWGLDILRLLSNPLLSRLLLWDG